MNIKNELGLINNYTRSPLSEKDVYIFTLTLCDNETDRDFERFSTESLTRLGELFIGKTGISDHSMRSKDQRARIFRTYIEKSPDKKTSCGEVYTALKARAYMLRTKENESLIREIEGGIKKEVSVGCSMKECICSICGKDMKRHMCEHIKGRVYEGSVCHGILKEPADAYEWSFVAVPAQKNAGVTKAFKKEEKMTTEKFRSLPEDALITRKEMESLKRHIDSLEKLADEGRAYRESLISDIRKYALIIMPSVDVKAFVGGCEKMDIGEIKSLCTSMKSQAASLIPTEIQLKGKNMPETKDNSQFKI